MREKFYDAARGLFEQKRFQDAADAFLVLTILDSNVYAFWMGLGASEQKCAQYESAMMAYAMATVTDPSNPYPHLYSSQCYAEIEDVLSSLESIDCAIECAAKSEEYRGVKEQVEGIKKRLEEFIACKS
jgi:type III secretion system low calcium response chaperone LcrH/SycD